MKRTCILLAGFLCALAASASTYDFKFSGVKLSEALDRIADEHPELELNFIYNELDNYTVSANIHTDNPYEALRMVVGLNPVSVVNKGNKYYLEALQHGKFSYYGTVLASDDEPLPGVAVLLLSQRDSTVITYGSTDSRGRFSIPCDAGQVLAKLSCVGYLPLYLKCRDFNLGTIHMKESPVLLKGLNVEADMVKYSSDKSVYLPTTRQKNAATDGVDLLRRMAISQLIINPVDNTISTTGGQSVVVYINNQPASDEDISGLRTADVRRVEFLEYPTDAIYKGAQYAVNFIVQEYVYGGYTKFSDSFFFLQEITNKPNVYSKFSFRKMTYDLYLGFDQVKSSHVYSDQETEFHLQDQVVTRKLNNEDSRFQYIQLPVSFRAFYNTEKTKISNTIGYTFHDRNNSNRTGSLSIEPYSDGNYSFKEVAPFVNRSFFWRGGYDFYLPRNWNLYIEPRATYGRNASYMNYSTDIPGDQPIRTDAKENVLDTRMEVNAVKTIAEKHNISAIVEGGYTNNRINYYGNSNYRTKFDHSFYAISARYTARLGKFYLNTDGGLIQEFTSTNVTNFNDPYPFLHIYGSYSPNQKNQFTVWFQFAADSPETGELTPNVIQSNEFLYLTGNPNLRPSRHTTANLKYNITFSNKFSLSSYLQHFLNHKRSIVVYEPYNDGKALLRSYKNDGDFNRTQVGLNATLRLLDNSLIVQGTGEMTAYRSSGFYNFNKVRFNYSLYAAYYTGNFNFSAYYQSPNRNIASYAPEYNYDRSYYNISAGWSNNNWSIRFSLMNFVRNSYNYRRSETVTPLLTSYSYRFNGNYRRGANITVTYTIGYGKKLNRGNEVGSQGTSSSAILK